MLDYQIKELLYFCFKNNIQAPIDMINNNDIRGLNEFIKENAKEEDFEMIKNNLDLYTHIDGINKIDLSNLPVRSDGKIDHINVDYKQFIGLKIPFVYNYIYGEFEIVGVEMAYFEKASNKVNKGYKTFEKEYGDKLLIISKYVLRYDEEVVSLSTNELETLKLDKFEALR